MLSLLEYVAYECELLGISWSVPKKKRYPTAGEQYKVCYITPALCSGSKCVVGFLKYSKPFLIMNHVLRLHWGMYPNGNLAHI